MNLPIIITLIILLAAVVLFVTELLRMDLVALLVLASLALTGLVTPAEALSGFSNLAVVTVWAMFILSAGLSRTGVANIVGQQLLRLAGRSEARLLVVIMLAAGLKGIEEEIEPPDPVEEDVYGFDDRKLAKFYIKTLPESLGEAIGEFRRSKLMKEALGEHVFNKYLGIKTTEWNEFQKSVTDWELERYRDL